MRQEILYKLQLATTKALVIECTVPKPGNVSRFHDFPNQKFEHFLLSASELGLLLPRLASKECLGDAVLKATKHMLLAQAGGNTHLGSIILLTPLIKSASNSGVVDFSLAQKYIKEADWRETLKYIEAIRCTDFEKLPDIPGELNVKSPEVEEFVRRHETSLYDWMLAGVEVNGICYEYTHGFPLTQETAALIKENWNVDMVKAIQHGFLFALSRYVDNLVVGKKGLKYARALQKEAERLYNEGAALAEADSEKNKEFQRMFRKLAREGVNPGTTADIIAGALFLIFLAP